jgi:hypothetical protein
MSQNSTVLNAPDGPAAFWRIVLVTSFTLAAIGANLWIIATFGNSTPYHDDWDTLAAGLYVPYADSTLTLHDLVAPNGEHRHFTTRIISLTLTVMNGRWDPILQMIVNAGLHVALGVFVLLTFGRRLDRFAFAGLTLITLGLIAVPAAA